MRFDPLLLDEIRARLPVSQVVSRHVKIKRQGREYVGLSPFKSEKTPSFTVNDQKGFYHCFASGEHGDIFTFTMKTEGLSFPEAVEMLAREAGVPLPEPTAQMEQKKDHYRRLYELTEVACLFFEEQLKARGGREARDYLQKRQVTEPQQLAFRIGYAPSGRTSLKEHLTAKGFSQDEMIMAGMVISGEDIATPYDRFRQRIIFPILDLKGRVIAFGGRALDPNQRAKYLNSPETDLFHKSEILFNASRARQVAYEKNQVIVVEGYMDVIALHGAGFENAVAPLGTAFTKHQLKLLWRMGADEPVLCFDGDEAGRKAAFRALETALPHLRPAQSLRFAFLPQGQDPDDLIRTGGSQAFRAEINRAQNLADVIWMKEAGSDLWETPERRAALYERIKKLLNMIQDPAVRDAYWGEARGELRRLNEKKVYLRPSASPKGRSVRRNNIRADWRMRSPLKAPRWQTKETGEPATDNLMMSRIIRQSTSPCALEREALLLLTLLNHPWMISEYAEEIAEIQFEKQSFNQLNHDILEIEISCNPLDKATLDAQLNLKGQDALISQIEQIITHRSDLFARPEADAKQVRLGWTHIFALHKKLHHLKEIREAAEYADGNGVNEEVCRHLMEASRQVAESEGRELVREEDGPVMLRARREDHMEEEG